MPTSAVVDLTLVPGSGCDARLFAPQVEALHGATRTHFVENTEHSRIDRLARHALDRLPERFALAGLSQGGLIALEIVRQAPERVLGWRCSTPFPVPGCASTGSGIGWRSPCWRRGRSIRSTASCGPAMSPGAVA